MLLAEQVEWPAAIVIVVMVLANLYFMLQVIKSDKD